MRPVGPEDLDHLVDPEYLVDPVRHLNRLGHLLLLDPEGLDHPGHP